MTAAASAPLRWVYFGLGWVFFGVGVLGAFLPLIPTTGPMLLALWAFSRSSRRFHDWLYNHRVFGPPLQRWRRERSLPLWVKLFAFASMGASLAYVGLVVRPPWYVIAVMIAVIAAGVVYIARIPTRAPEPRLAAADPAGAAADRPEEPRA